VDNLKNDYKLLAHDLKTNHRATIYKHPMFGYFVLGIILMLLQFSFMFNVGGFVTLTISRVISTTMIYTVAAMGLGILVGMAGLISLGTAAFVGLGAYTAANLMINFTNIPFTLVIVLSLLIAIIFGGIIGFISLRVRGIYLLVITLAFATIMNEIFVVETPFTGRGHGGLSGVPFPTLAGFLELNRETVYFLVLAMLIVLSWITLNIIKSPTGRAMFAMFASEPLARAMGISLLKYRVLAFIIATCYAMIAGVLHASSFPAVNPLSWTFMLSLNLLAVVILGGSIKPAGIMLGSFVIFALDLIFLRNIPFFANNPQAVIILTGILMIVIFAKFPGGLTRLVLELKFLIFRLFRKWRVYRYGPEV